METFLKALDKFFKSAWFWWAWNKPNSQIKGDNKAKIKEIFYREMSEIENSVIAFAEYQTTEAEILNARLSRRYDPGMAVNEAANRAIEAKKAAREPSPSTLTNAQLMALEFQKQYLKRVIERS